MEITAEHRAARNQASIDQADAGAGASRLNFRIGRNGPVVAVLHLAKPCGTLTPEGYISLNPAATIDLAAASGTPDWVDWTNGDDEIIGGDVVTPASGDGAFKIKGSGMVYEGVRVELELPAIIE